MGKLKQPKNNVYSFYKGDKDKGTIIRLTEFVPDKEWSEEELQTLFKDQGEALGIALMDVLPTGTVVNMVSFIYGALERILEQGEGEEGKDENN